MKKRALAIILALFCLISTMALPVSAASDGYVDITIYGTQDYEEINEVYRLVNEARAAEGLPALTIDPYLVACAMQRAAELSVYYSHTRPNGTTYLSVADSLYGPYVGENIAMGYPSAADVMTGWMNSEGHRANILKSSYTSIGIGCFYQDDGTKCWVQLFSRRVISDQYSESGTKTVHNIPIQVQPDLISLSVWGIEACIGFELFRDMDTPVQVRLNNLGWEYATPVILDGGYTISLSDTSVARISADYKTLTGLQPGSCTMTVQLDDILRGSLPVTVYASSQLTASIDANGSHILSWDDPSGQLYLFGKEADDELWTLFAYPSPGARTYTNYYVWDNEVWTYVLRARTGDYDYMEISDRITVMDLKAPELEVGNVASTGKIKLTWNKVAGAVKYQVYRATSKTGTYKLLSTTTGTSLTNTSAEVGKTYYYKVRSVAADNTKSEFSNIVSRTCDLPRPEITLSNIAESGKIKISWKKIDGATKYEVYRSTDNKNWSLLKSTTGTSLNNTSTTAGKLYYYKVKAIHEKSAANSAYSEVKNRRCDLPQPVITLSNVASTGKVKISWEKIDGAVQYEVYRSTDKNTWTLLKSTTGTSLTNTGAKAGVLYYYKVKAIASNSTADSAYSAVKSRTCDLARPTLTVKLNSSGKPVLTWTAVESAVKYEIYRSTDNKTWSLLKATTGTKLTNTSAKAGTTYYYKVRAIASISNANSAYSPVKSVTAK